MVLLPLLLLPPLLLLLFVLLAFVCWRLKKQLENLIDRHSRRANKERRWIEGEREEGDRLLASSAGGFGALE